MPENALADRSVWDAIFLGLGLVVGLVLLIWPDGDDEDEGAGDDAGPEL